MIFRRRMIQTLIAALVLVASAAAWVAFAPLQFGGSTSYVIIAGASMEPELRRGDLVLVREAQQYSTDDVVTYQHPRIGPIIHRIVDRRSAGFVLKGDNNDWIDSYNPGSDEIVGKAWLHLPGVGSHLQKLVQPLNLAILSLGISGLLYLSFRKGRSSEGSEEPFFRRIWDHPVIPKKAGDDPEGLLLVFAVLGFASIILAVVAFTRPVFVQTENIIDYKHSGSYRYFAAAPPDVYDTRLISTGDPIFLRLTDEMEIRFDYEFQGNNLQDFLGTYSLIAEIGDHSGWRRIIEIQPQTEFTGPSFATSGDLDLRQITEYVQTLEESTGVNKQSYLLALYPVVRIEGRVDGQVVSDFFNPRLEFIYDELQIQLLQSDPSNPDTDPVNPENLNMLMTPTLVPGTISVLSFELPVSTARWISALGLIVALFGLGWFGTLVYRASQSGGDILYRFKYSGLIVDVTSGMIDKKEQIVEVASMDDLARLAEQNGQKILHDEEKGNHRYFIKSEGIVYVFSLPGTEATVKGSNGSGAKKKPVRRKKAAKK